MLPTASAMRRRTIAQADTTPITVSARWRSCRPTTISRCKKSPTSMGMTPMMSVMRPAATQSMAHTAIRNA